MWPVCVGIEDMPNVELRVLSGSQSGTSIPLPEGKFLIGREQDCHLRPNSELVSRHHCAFTTDSFSVRVRDLGSTNGTFVNDEPVRGMTVLKAGDRVRVGKLDLVVVVDGRPVVDAEDTIHAQADETFVGNRPTKAGTSSGDSSIDFASMADEVARLEDDTRLLPPTAEPEAAPEPLPATPTDTQEFAAAVAQSPDGQPQFAPNPWGAAPQYPYPGGYPQYPGMPYGYGYPYPGMPQMPPGYGYPPPPQPSVPLEEPAKAERPSGMPEIRLPDPKETGAKAPEPPPAAASGEGQSAASKGANVPNAAQSIINSYLNRRPKTE